MMKKLFLLAAFASALPALAAYETNFPAGTKINNDNARAVNAVKLDDQSAAVSQATDRVLYHDLSATAIFTAKAGTAVKPAMDWTGTWMHGYLYIDLDSDGSFDPKSELVSFTYLGGRNSIAQAAEANCGPADLPEFIMPDLKPGDYRMRYIVDWDSTDPKGRNTADNKITTNNGAITDVTLRITEAAPAPSTGNYDVNFPADAKITHSDNPIRRLKGFTLSSATAGAQTVNVGQQDDLLLYHDRTATEIAATYGEPISLSLDWTGRGWMNTYIYIDRNSDGVFDSQVASNGGALGGSDLIAFSNFSFKNSAAVPNDNGNVIAMPNFYVPDALEPGQYRARLKIDWDNIDPAGSDDILTHGGAITDFTLTVAEEFKVANINQMPLNCIMLSTSGQPLAETAVQGLDFTFKILPTLPGFAADKLIVRHGPADALTDTEFELGDDGIALIPGSAIDSDDITIYAIFTEQEDSEWTKVWGDEFNTGTLDARRWDYHPRYGATWNRLIATGIKQQKLVNKFEDGCYNAYCIKTPEEFTNETAEMISGAIYSQGKFDFHYGKIEARIKTRPHVGNFPAFWLMPSTNAEGGWPLSGEIDIWEQVNNDNVAHATIHSGWKNWSSDLKWETGPKKSSPTGTHAQNVDAAKWHVFALEWDEEQLRWYVDGVHVFTYTNQHYSEPGTNYTEQVCWPFYKNFYVILNQSVGKPGGWAKAPDTNFEYKTQFDYVRVYKKNGDKNMTSITSDNGDDPDFFVALPEKGENPPVKIENISTESEESPIYFDINGRRISAPRAGGVYIRKCGTQVSKVIL